jgi:hypothetical protein
MPKAFLMTGNRHDDHHMEEEGKRCCFFYFIYYSCISFIREKENKERDNDKGYFCSNGCNIEVRADVKMKFKFNPKPVTHTKHMEKYHLELNRFR